MRRKRTASRKAKTSSKRKTSKHSSAAKKRVGKIREKIQRKHIVFTSIIGVVAVLLLLAYTFSQSGIYMYDQLGIGMFLGNQVPVLTKNSWPDGLPDHTLRYTGGIARYDQTIRFSDTSYLIDPLESGQVVNEPNNDDVIGTYLKFNQGDDMFEYVMSFFDPAQSELENIGGKLHLHDLEGEQFNILGTMFTLVDSEINMVTNRIKLRFMGSDSFALEEGEETVLPIGGINYHLKVLSIPDQNPRALIEIFAQSETGGIVSKRINLEVGECIPFENLDTGIPFTGTRTTCIKDIMVNEGEDGKDYLELTAGVSNIIIRDDDYTDDLFSRSAVVVNGETIEDGKIKIVGNDDNVDTFTLSRIQYRLEADAPGGDVYVGPGQGLRDVLDEPEGLLTPTWDLRFAIGGFGVGFTGGAVAKMLGISGMMTADDLGFGSSSSSTSSVPTTTSTSGGSSSSSSSGRIGLGIIPDVGQDNRPESLPTATAGAGAAAPPASSSPASTAAPGTTLTGCAKYNGAEIKFDSSGDHGYKLKFKNINDQYYNIPFIDIDNFFHYGDSGKTLHLHEAAAANNFIIQPNDLFVVSSADDENGVTNVIKYRTFDPVSNKATFTDQGGDGRGRNDLEPTVDPGTMSGTFTVSGYSYTFYVSPVAPYPIAVDMNRNNAWGNTMTMTFEGGAVLIIPAGAAIAGTTSLFLRTVAAKFKGDRFTNENIQVDITDQGNQIEIDVPRVQGDIRMYKVESTRAMEGMSSYGACFSLNEDKDPNELTIKYPSSRYYAGASVTSPTGGAIVRAEPLPELGYMLSIKSRVPKEKSFFSGLFG